MTVNDEDWKARGLADQYLHMILYTEWKSERPVMIINIANQMAALAIKHGNSCMSCHWFLCSCNAVEPINGFEFNLNPYIYILILHP